VIERAVILAPGDTIELADLPEEFSCAPDGIGRRCARVTLDELETEHIRRILASSHNLDDAARISRDRPGDALQEAAASWGCRSPAKRACCEPASSFGLLPLLLVIVVTGAYAIRVCHQLAGPLQKDLVADYREALGCQDMRTSAILMSNALAFATARGPTVARRALDERRSAFTRELMGQSAASAGRPRARLVEELDTVFQDFSTRCDRTLAAGASLDENMANEDALYRVLSSLDRLTASDYAASREAEARAEHLAATAVGILSATIVVAVALSVAIAWVLASSLLCRSRSSPPRPLHSEEGNLDVEVPEFSSDELGSLARSFNTMAARLRAYREATARSGAQDPTHDGGDAHLGARSPVCGFQGGVVEVRNPAAEELSKLPEFSGGFPPGLAAPLASVMATDEHYLPTDYGRVVTFRIGREDRHYLPRILAIGDKLTEFKGAAVILQDVTKFRLLDDAKTNLVGTVSHELKTPLTSLRMAVYLLLEKTLGPLAPQQREMLESARDDADRLLRILDSLLDLTRLEAGASALERRTVPVGELLRPIAEEARAFISVGGAGTCRRGGSRPWRRGRRRGQAPARVHQPPFERLEVFAGGQRDHAWRVRGAPRLRALFRKGQWAGHSRGGAAAHLRPVLPGAGPVEAGRRDRPGHRPRDRRRARRKHHLLGRPWRRDGVPLPGAGSVACPRIRRGQGAKESPGRIARAGETGLLTPWRAAWSPSTPFPRAPQPGPQGPRSSRCTCCRGWKARRAPSLRALRSPCRIRAAPPARSSRPFPAPRRRLSGPVSQNPRGPPGPSPW
jgi:NtrC-family two-component system sensor histidine kinase KinB